LYLESDSSCKACEEYLIADPKKGYRACVAPKCDPKLIVGKLGLCEKCEAYNLKGKDGKCHKPKCKAGFGIDTTG